MSTKTTSGKAMSVSTKRVNSARTTRPRNKQTQGKFATTAQVFGGKFSPPANPPDVEFQPWNRVTVVDPFTGTLTVTVQSLKDQLRKQLDPTGRGFNPSDSGDKRFVPSFKISTIQVWNLTGHIISLSVNDYTDTQSARGGRDQLVGIVDTGSPGLLPKAGYKLPASHKNHVLRCDDIESHIEIFAAQIPQNDQGLCYITLEYRFDGSTELPRVSGIFNVLTKCYDKVESIEATGHVTANETSSTSKTVLDILAALIPTNTVSTTAGNNSISPLLHPSVKHTLEELTTRIRQLEIADASSVSSSYGEI